MGHRCEICGLAYAGELCERCGSIGKESAIKLGQPESAKAPALPYSVSTHVYIREGEKDLAARVEVRFSDIFLTREQAEEISEAAAIMIGNRIAETLNANCKRGFN